MSSLKEKKAKMLARLKKQKKRTREKNFYYS